ncbi:dTMP kinase [Metallosphaera tengchongensis]|uniref:Probable thymidylate kinase n=1 Tax=Metallosphaera tengchongensis TaxID=1532350 RepID=A0A6N0NXN7_9CREN|nr:dTMP kinase [Metallosphaera tengchongensis]QKR00975.1 dTMP kinase [Metallosphaera tengchongensis]
MVKLIAIEGIDGSGKTTLARALHEKLSRKYKVVLTSEPFTQDILNLLEKYGWKDQVLLALLFSADREIHVRWMMEQDAEIIITDRYYYSTIAYQGVRVQEEWLISLNSVFPRPNLTILLDVPLDVAWERLSRKRDSMNFEEKLRSLGEVRERYLRLAKKEGFHVLDGTRPLEELVTASLDLILGSFSTSLRNLSI